MENRTYSLNILNYIVVFVYNLMENKILNRKKRLSCDTLQSNLLLQDKQNIPAFSSMTKSLNDIHLLQNQLSNVKEAAIKALLEKDQQITKLKIYNHELQLLLNPDQDKQKLKEQIDKLSSINIELNEQIKQLEEKCQKQRLMYFNQICSKEIVIEELSARVDKMENEVYEFQQQNNQLVKNLGESEKCVAFLADQMDKLREELYRRRRSSSDTYFNYIGKTQSSHKYQTNYSKQNQNTYKPQKIFIKGNDETYRLQGLKKIVKNLSASGQWQIKQQNEQLDSTRTNLQKNSSKLMDIEQNDNKNEQEEQQYRQQQQQERYEQEWRQNDNEINQISVDEDDDVVDLDRQSLMQRRHEEQMEYVVNFYENQIKIMKQVYRNNSNQTSHKNSRINTASKKCTKYRHCTIEEEELPEQEPQYVFQDSNGSNFYRHQLVQNNCSSSVQELMSNHSCSYYGAGQWKLSNLQSELRNLQSAQKSFFADDESVSQFTTKYFNYQNNTKNKQNCQATKVINFQQEYEIQQKNVLIPEKGEILYGIFGTFLGIFGTTFYFKFR